MLIIGLMTTAAVVLLPSEKPKINTDAEYVATVFQALARDSVMSGKLVGVEIEGDRMDVRTLTADGWRAQPALSSEDNAFLALARLSLEGVPLSPPADDEGEERAPAEFTPQLWFLPTGEIAAFDLAAETRSGSIRIAALGGSRFQVIYED